MKEAEIKGLQRTDLPPLGMWRLQMDGDRCIKDWAEKAIEEYADAPGQYQAEYGKLKVFERKLQKQAQEAAAYYKLLSEMRKITEELRKTADRKDARSIKGMRKFINSIADEYDHYLTKHEERNYG